MSAAPAAVNAHTRGGWDRGSNDCGLFGVRLHFSQDTVDTRGDHQRLFQARQPVAEPGNDSIRLRCAATLSVSNEEHYQPAIWSIVGDATPGFQVITELVRSRRSKVVHHAAGHLADGSVLITCGPTVKAADSVMLAATKPWLGDVDPLTRQIVTDCERCGRY